MPRSLVLFLIIAVATHAHAKLPFANVKLNCCVLLAPPYISHSHRRQQNGFDGLSIEYLRLLESRTGLKCHLHEYFNPDSVGWTAFIQNMEACTLPNGTLKSDPNCGCALGVGAWFEEEERMGVQFLPSYAYDGLTVLVHAQDTVASTGAAFFVKAFSPDAWMAILGLFVVFLMLKMLDVRFARKEECTRPRSASRVIRAKWFLLKNGPLYRLRRAVQSTFAKMTLQPLGDVAGDASTERSRWLNLVIILCGMFCMLVYESGMTAMLVQEEMISEYMGVEDFKECRIADKDVCFVRGDVIQTLWARSFAKMPCRKNSTEQPRRFPSYDAVLSALDSRECRYVIMDEGTATTAMHGRYCGRLQTTGEAFFQSGVSFVMPKNNWMYQGLRRATLQIREGDLLESREEYTKRSGVCEMEASTVLGWKRLRLFFILAFAAAGGIFLEMMFDPQTDWRADVRDVSVEDEDEEDFEAEFRRREGIDGMYSAGRATFSMFDEMDLGAD